MISSKVNPAFLFFALNILQPSVFLEFVEFLGFACQVEQAFHLAV
jgi:hypothetical protein